MGEPKLPVIGIPVKEMFGKFHCCKGCVTICFVGPLVWPFFMSCTTSSTLCLCVCFMCKLRFVIGSEIKFKQYYKTLDNIITSRFSSFQIGGTILNKLTLKNYVMEKSSNFFCKNLLTLYFVITEK